MARRVQLNVGDTYGSWTVLTAPTTGRLYFCQCVCGSRYFVRSNHLRKDASTQCRRCISRGKLSKSRSVVSDLSPALYRRLWATVQHAIARCTKPGNYAYGAYGGRSIQVHQQWLDNPSQFLAYIASLPGAGSKELELDRIDNDGNYEPGNLRFVTHRENMLNTRRQRATRRLPGSG